MKILNFSIAAMLLIATFAVSSCGGNHSHDNDGEQTEEQGKEYTAAYICPMHCEGSGSQTAGKCPVCGMDYVANKDTDKTEEAPIENTTETNEHEGHNHEGHEHDEHDH